MSQHLALTKGLSTFIDEFDGRRVALPADVWARLLDTLQVPEPNREQAAREISTILTIAVISYGIDAHESRAAADNLAASAVVARALRDHLLSFDVPERTMFEINAAGISVGREPDPGERARLAREMAQAIAANAMAGRYAHYERAIRAAEDTMISAITCHRPPGRVGRPPRNEIDHPQERAFDVLVTMLRRAAVERGWHLTLSHNFEGGTLIAVLGIVRPHLPKGLVPNALTMHRLRDLLNRADKSG